MCVNSLFFCSLKSSHLPSLFLFPLFSSPDISSSTFYFFSFRVDNILFSSSFSPHQPHFPFLFHPSLPLFPPILLPFYLLLFLSSLPSYPPSLLPFSSLPLLPSTSICFPILLSFLSPFPSIILPFLLFLPSPPSYLRFPCLFFVSSQPLSSPSFSFPI